ncbi:transcriptional regulator [Geothermobacter hydrogeniphilus]|uniref:Transcriptional regulator n=1 Tax=Geothermobacter hydrogeniphilus TaxID=1969733 RepID=A0A2K2H7S7_9BACT|nr:zinc ribbon domain-containing protein [Geothermobacter hydrogeniphilus]PNU19362.1 transcriptional regulator [Geothermobacter hydrogeniphilus]
MPLYEYLCESCGLKFEARQKFSDAPLTACRECGGAVRKLISQTAFTLKGGGWYAQGYGGSKTDSCSAGGKESKPSACDGCPKSAANA